mmetsp:Transcript_70148/g.123665  ORF Transcript_70148/g.123665 Transcript_70148/m.123665 type:complete len:307 (-) Transcript_70148:10418-11338(-)
MGHHSNTITTFFIRRSPDHCGSKWLRVQYIAPGNARGRRRGGAHCAAGYMQPGGWGLRRDSKAQRMGASQSRLYMRSTNCSFSISITASRCCSFSWAFSCTISALKIRSLLSRARASPSASGPPSTGSPSRRRRLLASAAFTRLWVISWMEASSSWVRMKGRCWACMSCIRSVTSSGLGTPCGTQKPTSSWNMDRAPTRAGSPTVLVVEKTWDSVRSPANPFLRHTLAQLWMQSWLNWIRSERMLLTTSQASTSRSTRSPSATPSGATGYPACDSSRWISFATSGMTSSCTFWPRRMPRIRKAPWE